MALTHVNGRRQKHVARQSILGELALRTIDAGLADVMSETVSALADNLGADFCEILARTPGQRSLTRVACSGADDERGSRALTVETSSYLEYALAGRSPLISNDLSGDGRFAAPAGLLARGLKSSVSALVVGRDSPWGLLRALSRRKRFFSPEDADFLQATANILAGAAHRDALTSELRHANRINAMGELSAGLVHELGTPVNVVSARARMILRDRVSGQELIDNVAAIDVQAERMARMVRELLDFSRQHPRREPVADVLELVERTVKLLRPVARKRRVSIRVEPGTRRLPVVADAPGLQQVLTNLIVNAVDAQPHGGIVGIDVEVTTAAEDGSGPAPPATGRPMVRISVADDGEGIPEDIADRIFEPFFTTKPPDRGTGLGLAVSRDIVAEFGGSLTGENRPTGGAVFRIHLQQESS